MLIMMNCLTTVLLELQKILRSGLERPLGEDGPRIDTDSGAMYSIVCSHCPLAWGNPHRITNASEENRQICQPDFWKHYRSRQPRDYLLDSQPVHIPPSGSLYFRPGVLLA
jgi:hypothetical protein